MTWRAVLPALALGLLLAAPAAVQAALPTIHFHAEDITGTGYDTTNGVTPVTVWVFIAHDCPFSNEYGPLLHRLSTAFDSKDVQWRLVYAEPDLPLADLKAHAESYPLKSPAFADPDLRLALACGVTITPEVAVIDRSGTLVYRGRIDDTHADLAHRRLVPEVHDLRDAIELTIQGKPVPHPRTQAAGCVLELPPGAPAPIVP